MIKKSLVISSLLFSSLYAANYTFVKTQAIATGNTYEFPATIYSPKESSLSTRVTGYIKNMRVEEGDRVKAGQLLAEIDPVETQTLYQGATASLNIAKSHYDDAKRDYERYKILYEKGVIPLRDLEKSELALKTKKELLQSAESQVTTTKNQFNYTSITAPVSGFIAKKLANVGELASMGRPLFIISQTHSLQAQAFIPESAITALSTQASLLLTIPALNKTLPITLKTLVPSSDPATHTLIAKFSLKDTHGIIPGMYGKIQLSQSQSQGVSIPLSAIAKRSGITGLFTVTNNSVRFIKVSVLSTQGDNAIIQGINAGVNVINYPKENLHDGKSL